MAHPPDGITIRHLMHAPHVLPVLAQWFVEEWEPYYGPTGPGCGRLHYPPARRMDRCVRKGIERLGVPPRERPEPLQVARGSPCGKCTRQHDVGHQEREDRDPSPIGRTPDTPRISRSAD